MPETDLNWLSATEQAALIRSRKVSPVEIVDALLARIDKVNPRLNAFVLINADQARREAKSAERAVGKRGARLGPLHGVPFGVKDLVVTRGVRTTFGTPLYRDNVPTEDAPMVERLKAAVAALGWDVAAGPDERDPSSLPADGARYSRGLGRDLKALRVAYTDDLGFAEVVDPEVSAVCARAAKAFRELGCRVDEVQPKWPSMMECWEQIFCGGIATRMAPSLDQRDLIEPGLLRFIEATLKNPPTRYVQAWLDRLN